MHVAISLLYKYVKSYCKFYVNFISSLDLNNYIKKNTMSPFLYSGCKYIILHLCNYIGEQLDGVIEN